MPSLEADSTSTDPSPTRSRTASAKVVAPPEGSSSRSTTNRRTPAFPAREMAAEMRLGSAGRPGSIQYPESRTRVATWSGVWAPAGTARRTSKPIRARTKSKRRLMADTLDGGPGMEPALKGHPRGVDTGPVEPEAILVAYRSSRRLIAGLAALNALTVAAAAFTVAADGGWRGTWMTNAAAAYAVASLLISWLILRVSGRSLDVHPTWFDYRTSTESLRARWDQVDTVYAAPARDLRPAPPLGAIRIPLRGLRAPGGCRHGGGSRRRPGEGHRRAHTAAPLRPVGGPPARRPARVLRPGHPGAPRPGGAVPVLPVRRSRRDRHPPPGPRQAGTGAEGQAAPAVHPSRTSAQRPGAPRSARPAPGLAGSPRRPRPQRPNRARAKNQRLDGPLGHPPGEVGVPGRPVGDVHPQREAGPHEVGLQRAANAVEHLELEGLPPRPGQLAGLRHQAVVVSGHRRADALAGHEVPQQRAESLVHLRSPPHRHLLGLVVGPLAEAQVAAEGHDPGQVGRGAMQVGLQRQAQVPMVCLDPAVEVDGHLGEGALLHVHGDRGARRRRPCGQGSAATPRRRRRPAPAPAGSASPRCWPPGPRRRCGRWPPGSRRGPGRRGAGR